MNKSIILIFLTVISLTLVSADITFPYQSPSTSTITDNYEFEYYANITINETLDTIVYNFNNTNYTLFDSSVLMYNFDNRTGLPCGSGTKENDTCVADISKYGNNGTVYGAIVNTSGKYNNAFTFDGVDDYIGVTDSNNNLNLTGELTLSAWVKTPNVDAVTKTIIAKSNGAYGGIQYELRLGGNDISFLAANTTATAAGLFTALYNDQINPNVWYSIVATINSTNTLKIYINGVSGGSTATVIGTRTSTTENLAVGTRKPSSPSNYWNGTIDNAIILNRSLSASEISQLYRINLEKYNQTNWGLYANESIRNENLSTTNLNESYDYGLYVNDTAGNSNSTLNTITRIPLLTSTIGNFTTQKGTVRSDFYGFSGLDTFTSYDNVSNDNDCTRESIANYTKVRNDILNAKGSFLREEVDLRSYSVSDGVVNASPKLEEAIQSARDNNQKILLLIVYTPNWIANQTSGWCNVSNQVNANYSCPPINYSNYGKIIYDVVYNITKGGENNGSVEIELLNEPYASGWLNNLSGDHITKGKEYVKLFNDSRNYFKAKFPNIPFGGGGIYYITDLGGGRNISLTFISNITNADFYVYHQYNTVNGALMTSYQSVENATMWIMEKCALYGANCSRLVLSEWNQLYNLGNIFSPTHSMTTSLTYSYLLNNYPENISSMIFKLDAKYKNSSCDNYFNYSLIDSINGIYHEPFNVTKNFASYCPAGSVVYQSSSNNSYLKTVTCCKGNSCNIIIINTDVESKNVTLNLAGSGITNLTNFETHINYSASGIINIGLLDSYGILYLGSYTPQTTYNEVCTNMVSNLVGYIVLIGLIGTVIFISIIIGYVSGFLDIKSVIRISVIDSVLTLILIGFAIIISIFIISSLCSL